MNDFDRCMEIGARGQATITSVLEKEYQGQALEVRFDGHDGFQRNGGDLIVAQRIGTALTIEVKTEEKETGNICFEEWSDFLKEPGWGCVLRCQILAYYFLDTGNLYLFDWSELRRHMYNTGERCKRKRQRKYEQHNKTVNLLPSLCEVGAAIGWTRIKVQSGQREVRRPYSEPRGLFATDIT